ncbi:hypothetical protein M8J76_004909 [Diaphorina citri]|nr:hypothetical protein M8J76_004909 [Diaphorina citri]
MSPELIIVLCAALWLLQDVRCAPKEEEEDDIFSFSSAKTAVPIRSPSSSATKSKSSQSTSDNPFNGIQELTNQFKDGNFNNLKKISDSNANTMMNVLGLGSNWMSTNLRLANQWNDLNRDLGEKLIESFHKMNDNNLRFIKQQVENTNSKIKASLDPGYKQISAVRDTFNANDKEDSANSLALVSKSGRPLETLVDIKNELPPGIVNAASGWFGG